MGLSQLPLWASRGREPSWCIDLGSCLQCSLTNSEWSLQQWWGKHEQSVLFGSVRCLCSENCKPRMELWGSDFGKNRAREGLSWAFCLVTGSIKGKDVPSTACSMSCISTVGSNGTSSHLHKTIDHHTILQAQTNQTACLDLKITSFVYQLSLFTR